MENSNKINNNNDIDPSTGLKKEYHNLLFGNPITAIFPELLNSDDEIIEEVPSDYIRFNDYLDYSSLYRELDDGFYYEITQYYPDYFIDIKYFIILEKIYKNYFMHLFQDPKYFNSCFNFNSILAPKGFYENFSLFIKKYKLENFQYILIQFIATFIELKRTEFHLWLSPSGIEQIKKNNIETEKLKKLKLQLKNDSDCKLHKITFTFKDKANDTKRKTIKFDNAYFNQFLIKDVFHMFDKNNIPYANCYAPYISELPKKHNYIDLLKKKIVFALKDFLVQEAKFKLLANQKSKTTINYCISEFLLLASWDFRDTDGRPTKDIKLISNQIKTILSRK